MKSSVIGCLVLSGLIGSFATMSAQAPVATPSTPVTATPAKPAGPALDDLDKAQLTAVSFAMKRANDACQSLQAVEEYNQIRQQVQTAIEGKHKGFTVNWSTFQLTPIAKPAK